MVVGQLLLQRVAVVVRVAMNRQQVRGLVAAEAGGGGWRGGLPQGERGARAAQGERGAAR